MLREYINDARAKRGQNAVPTGLPGKDTMMRLSTTPSWVYMERIGETDWSYIFDAGAGTKKYVPKGQVDGYKG
jgi:hypothetical protein